jgi:hypothetical protein
MSLGTVRFEVKTVGRNQPAVDSSLYTISRIVYYEFCILNFVI